MPPETTPPAATTLVAKTATVTNESSYLFGKIGKVISETEHEIVVLFEEAERKIKETFEPKHVSVKAATPPPVAPAAPTASSTATASTAPAATPSSAPASSVPATSPSTPAASASAPAPTTPPASA